jgi:hypothetical protein
MYGCKWSLLKVREENYKGSMVGPRWNLEAERVWFSSTGALKIYANLWEGKNLVILLVINEGRSMGGSWAR